MENIMRTWKLIFINVLLLITFKISRAQRRIVEGSVVKANKPYVAYLIKAERAKVQYDAWICGGAIVNEWFILTSAACVEDVQHMYAVAGYNKYVPLNQRDGDKCLKETKKKIVWVCVPKAYEFDYSRVDKWAFIDIAAVKVESKFNFNDEIYTTVCSYKPAPIEINYENKYQQPYMDVVVYGWGHKSRWRKPEDSVDYNQRSLNFASTLIHDKENCKHYYAEVSGMDYIIDKYMICTFNKGNIDDRGDIVTKSPPTADGCEKMPGVQCPPYYNLLYRRSDIINSTKTRRQGICQNDHGGPLVTWIGTHEVLLGVASVFRVTDASTCTGPYLFTSTQCNGAFIDCVINYSDGENSEKYRTDPYYRKRSDFCRQMPADKGFDSIERTISWKNHPDGPAQNEYDYFMRPQVPYAYDSYPQTFV